MKKDLLKLKADYPWLNDVDSCILRTSLDDLDNAYKKFFNKEAGYPKYKRKNNHDTYRTICNRSTYKGNNYQSIKIDLDKRVIILPKLKEVAIRGYRNKYNFNGKILNATISKTSNKYYVSVCVEEDIIEPEFTFTRMVGLDLGIKNIVITSDGEKYDNNLKKINMIEKRIKGLQKSLSRCVKNSNNSRKIILKIQRAYQKIKNIRKYNIHSITNKLIKENDVIVIEDLSVKKMIEQGTNGLSRNISNTAFNEIIRTLTYKLKWCNKKILKVDKYYASSKICSHCGSKTEVTNDLNVRKWECKNCHYINDRDINASINILDKGIEMYFREVYNS